MSKPSDQPPAAGKETPRTNPKRLEYRKVIAIEEILNCGHRFLTPLQEGRHPAFRYQPARRNCLQCGAAIDRLLDAVVKS